MVWGRRNTTVGVLGLARGIVSGGPELALRDNPGLADMARLLSNLSVFLSSGPHFLETWLRQAMSRSDALSQSHLRALVEALLQRASQGEGDD